MDDFYFGYRLISETGVDFFKNKFFSVLDFERKKRRKRRLNYRVPLLFCPRGKSIFCGRQNSASSSPTISCQPAKMSTSTKPLLPKICLAKGRMVF